MKKLLDAILVKLGLRHRSFIVLTPDNKQLFLEGIHCTNCTNAFWIEHLAIEAPHRCPYCGIRFAELTEIDNEAFEERRDSTD